MSGTPSAMVITADTRVADVAAASPATLRVFQRHGIDFCCGGKRTLGVVCREQRIDFAALRRALAAAVEHGRTPPTAAGPVPDERAAAAAGEGTGAPAGGRAGDWRERSPSALAEHVVARYHGWLREELPRLGAMAEKVLRVHGDHHPAVIPPLVATFSRLRAELEAHMLEEEVTLFPGIERLAGKPAGAPGPAIALGAVIAAMEGEHAAVGAGLARLRELTSGYRPPAGACMTFRGLYAGLEELEAELHEHIHVENNVLFPLVERLERERGLLR